MFVKSTDLNDLAVSLANVLRNFDPNTMFWDEKAPTVFPNCDENGFDIPQDIRKPFGVQRILESFAKSAGYNSYKGLLEANLPTKLKNNDYLNVDINSLNPNPRSAYFTAYWKAFTNCLMGDIRFADNNKTGSIPHTLYQNTQIPSSIKYAPYMGWGMASICEYNLRYNKEIRIGEVVGGFNQASKTNLSHYYPIAEAIVFSLLELNLTEVDTGRKYLKEYSIDDIPLSSFFKITNWSYDDLPLFLKSLARAMFQFFLVDMKVTGPKGFENKLVHFHFRYDVLEKFKTAKKHFEVHQALKAQIHEWMKNTVSENQHYIYPYFTQHNVMQELGNQRELGYYALKSYIENNNSKSNFLRLSKQSWVNYCLKIATCPLNLLDGYDESLFNVRIDQFLSKLIKVEVSPLQEQNVPGFQYHFSLSNYDYICRNDDENVLLPHRVTVRSEQELVSPFAELAVQAEVLKLLPSRIDLDYYTKLAGAPSMIAFENERGDMLDPIIALKKIGNLKKPDLIIDFNIKEIIQQITIDPFVHDGNPNSIYDIDKVLNPKTGQPVEFESMFGCLDSTLFFNLNLTLVDTISPMSEFHSTSDGFNTLELYVEYDLKNRFIEVLDMSTFGVDSSKKVRNQYKKVLNFLMDEPQFNELIFKALKYTQASYEKHAETERSLLDIMTIYKIEDQEFFMVN
jgi:hypothetical protein